jgi:hypothetical protein
MTVSVVLYGDIQTCRLLGLALVSDEKQIEIKAERAIENFMTLFAI